LSLCYRIFRAEIAAPTFRTGALATTVLVTQRANGVLRSASVPSAMGRGWGKLKMKCSAEKAGAARSRRIPTVPGRLFRKYAAIFVAVVCAALVANGIFEVWFSYQEQRSLLARIQQEQAKAVASRISQFIGEIEDQIAWATLVSWDVNAFDDWRFDAMRLLRQVPAISEVAQIDGNGRELFRVSRQAMDVVGSRTDYSQQPFFVQALAKRVYYGPVYFAAGSEPYMTIAMSGYRPDDGVIEVQVNLKFIWDIVSQIKVGRRGYAYVIDDQGRLIAYPDISLVLRKTDMSGQPQVVAARASLGADQDRWFTQIAGVSGSVLSAHALVAPVNWLVFVELPSREALAPIYNSILRLAAVLLAALALALLAGLILARKMVVPIRALHDGAARVGRGDLTHRIAIDTGDELEALGTEFNNMATRLQESHATLEAKVEERTRQLEDANLAKSRFLAAASHDLRQPLHAIGLFVAQLHGNLRAGERRRIVGRIETALSAMNELFGALLDISKLDAGATTPNITDFPVAQLLARAETTFGEVAREKGLSFRVVPSRASIRSDFILLERIVLNLVSNAVYYTRRGGLVVGCRRRGEQLRIEVWDSGIGFPPDQHERIFTEFYRFGEPDRVHRTGLGLGLAIVERLCRLLDHPIDVRSIPDRGSTFAVTVPLASSSRTKIAERPVPAADALNLSKDKLVVVIDDDPVVLEGMSGIFRSWGCQVISANTDRKVLDELAEQSHAPDLIISDYFLSGGRTGLETIEHLRNVLSAQIPAFLISGSIHPEPEREARAKGCHLLHKPVDPMALRAMFTRAIRPAQKSRQIRPRLEDEANAPLGDDPVKPVGV
jgi:signal transduction histidine kinase/FixJ family two-component response regulator